MAQLKMEIGSSRWFSWSSGLSAAGAAALCGNGKLQADRSTPWAREAYLKAVLESRF